MPDGNHHQQRAVRRWSAMLLGLCAAVFWIQCTDIARTVPYPRHVDEGFISGPANRTLVTGTFHPYKFNYPSLPKYLASAAMATGFLRAATHLEIRDVSKIGNVGYPYYSAPRVMQTARQLFALFSVLALAATGALAWSTLMMPSAIFVAPLLVSASALFFYQSWAYLNVDIIALCFSTWTLAASMLGTRRPSILQSALIPGICAGLAMGSKYTQALVIGPVLLAIGLYLPRGQRLWGALVALGAMALTFIIVVPYSLIDLPSFLNDVAFEAFHYASGHTGFEADPGLPQVVFYGRHFLTDYGRTAIALAVLGAIGLIRADWRRAAVMLSFPLLLGRLLVVQHVHFERNVFPLHPILTVLAASGLVAVHQWLSDRAGRFDTTRAPYVRWALAVLLVILVLPLRRVSAELRDQTDSRNKALAWMEQHVPAGWTVIVPEQLAFDAHPLKAHGLHVIEVDLKAATDTDAFEQILSGTATGPALIMLPEWGADERRNGQVTADALNTLGRLLKPVVRFGTNPVLVNSNETVPWGDPIVGIVPLGGLTLP